MNALVERAINGAQAENSSTRSERELDPTYFSEGMRSDQNRMDVKRTLRDSRPKDSDWKAAENDR